MPIGPEWSTGSVLPRHLRARHARAQGPGCAVWLLLLVVIASALVALQAPGVLWVLGPVLVLLLYFVVTSVMQQRREVRDESRWAIERVEYRPRRAWRVLADPEDEGDSDWRYNECVLFREADGRWGVLLPVAVSVYTDGDTFDWEKGVPAEIAVVRVLGDHRIVRVSASAESVTFSGTVVLDGPSVLRMDGPPIFRVERFEDLPPVLVRALGAVDRV